MNFNSDKQISIKLFLPDSFLSNISTLLLKTIKVGNLARIFNIYRIDKVYFYGNKLTTNNKQIINDILAYLNVAPYLRKFIPKSPSLKFAAILPPMQSPNHTGFHYNKGYYKEGLILKKKKLTNSQFYDITIEIGEKKPLNLTISANLYRNIEETNILIIELNEKKILNQDCVDFFWKFDFEFLNSDLSDFIGRIKGPNHLVLAASRYGNDISDSTIYYDLKRRIHECKEIILLFGPLKGSFIKHLEEQKFDINLIDSWINFIPNQGTITVKLEEAIISSLSILNIL